MKVLKYPPIADAPADSELERHVQQLATLAHALADEIETLKAELSEDHDHDSPIDFARDGIDFYQEIERYEIDLIKRALNHSGGNQTQAARMLGLKSTTLNAKMKHYGLNPVRSIMSRHAAPTK